MAVRVQVPLRVQNQSECESESANTPLIFLRSHTHTHTEPPRIGVHHNRVIHTEVLKGAKSVDWYSSGVAH